MAISAIEQKLLTTYPQWNLNPNHPNNSVTYQAAVHLVDECRSSGFFPDNGNGYWTPVIQAVAAAGWHIDNIRGNYELVELKPGVSPGLRQLTDSDVRFYLY